MTSLPSILMLTGIGDILIATAPTGQGVFREFLGDGLHWTVNLIYAVQPRLEGIAQAFDIGADLIGSHPVRLSGIHRAFPTASTC